MADATIDDTAWIWPAIFDNPDGPYLPDATPGQRQSAALTDQMVTYIGYFTTGHRPENFMKVLEELSLHSGTEEAGEIMDWAVRKKSLKYPATDAALIKLLDEDIKVLERRRARIVANYPKGQMPPPRKKKGLFWWLK